MNLPILLYHSISNEATDRYRPWAVPPRQFSDHLSYLQDEGYNPLTLGQLATAIRSGNVRNLIRPVVITFDDGLRDFLDPKDY